MTTHMTSQDPTAFRRSDRKDKKRFRTDVTEVSLPLASTPYSNACLPFSYIYRSLLSSNHPPVQLRAIRCKSSSCLLHTHSSHAPSLHSLLLLQALPLSIPPRRHSVASSLSITFRITLCNLPQSTTRVPTTKYHASLNMASKLWM